MPRGSKKKGGHVRTEGMYVTGKINTSTGSFSAYLDGVLCQIQGFQLSAVIETQWEGDEAVGADVKAGQKSDLEISI